MPLPMEMAAPESYVDSPFTDDIATVALPNGFSAPTMTLFDGTADPCDHISQFKQKMMVTAATGASKEAFLQSGEHQATKRHCDGIVQEIGESIKDYVTRFNAEKVSIRGCDVSTAINAFRQGLDKESSLYKELTMYPCERFDEVQQRATAALRLEEDIQARKGVTNFDKTSRKFRVEKKDERAKPYSRPNISRITEKLSKLTTLCIPLNYLSTDSTREWKDC
ncbi:uncharacterized protein LOC141628250 [Silene latifolia]|uniref:uncharacterized protein LOC141628250 n=1 Tax=Silene latifolia TaxID=37657 RepID=UPI003D77FEFE